MFKKLRKWYFKLYHLFRLLGIFILIFGIQKNVYAIESEEYQENFKIAEESCTDNLMKPILINTARFNRGSNKYGKNNINKATYLIKVKENTTYYITFDFTIGSGSLWYFTGEPGNAQLVGDITNNRSYTTPKGTKYIGLMFGNNAWNNLTDKKIALYEGTKAKDYVEYSTSCSTPETPQENEVYANFLTIYTDRLIYLANGFTSNPYLIAMIGIIFAWVVLELFLKILHLRGGKYK